MDGTDGEPCGSYEGLDDAGSAHVDCNGDIIAGATLPNAGHYKWFSADLFQRLSTLSVSVLDRPGTPLDEIVGMATSRHSEQDQEHTAHGSSSDDLAQTRKACDFDASVVTLCVRVP
jgi:hypothetical protein